MKTIILKVQSNGSGGWRLGISAEDSNFFRCRKVQVRLTLTDNLVCFCNTACGIPCDDNGNRVLSNPQTAKPYKKGYDLNNKVLSEWLSENYTNIIKGKPRNLIFSLNEENGMVHLNFIGEYYY